MALGGYVHGATRRRTPLDDMQDQIDALTKSHDELLRLNQKANEKIQRLTRRFDSLEEPQAMTATPVAVKTKRVSTQRASEHIKALNAQDISSCAIANACGIHKGTISAIRNRKREFITSSTEALILAVQPEERTMR